MGFDECLTDQEWLQFAAFVESGGRYKEWRGVVLGGHGKWARAWRGSRDLVAVLLMGEAGLRVAETVGICWVDVWFGEDPREVLTVPEAIAKGGNERRVPIGPRLAAGLKSYRGMIRRTSGPLQSAVVMAGPEGEAGVTVRQLERLVKSYGLRCFGRRVTPHMLRHTFATRLLAVTNMRTVQQCLGHASIRTTEIYTHVDDGEKRRALAVLGGGRDPGRGNAGTG